MNIHLPAILGFTRYQGFDPSPYQDYLDTQWYARLQVVFKNLPHDLPWLALEWYLGMWVCLNVESLETLLFCVEIDSWEDDLGVSKFTFELSWGSYINVTWRKSFKKIGPILQGGYCCGSIRCPRQGRTLQVWNQTGIKSGGEHIFIHMCTRTCMYIYICICIYIII